MLLIQPRQDLPDGPEMICRMSGGGKSGGSAQVVPMRARGNDLPPFVGLVAEQRERLSSGGASVLVTPRERVYRPADPAVASRLWLAE